MAKSQFESSSVLEVRFTPFLNRNDGSEISGDTCRLYLKCPDGTLLDSTTNPGDVPLPTYLSDIGFWKSDIPATVRTTHGAGAYLAKAVSDNTNAMTQRKVYTWGDYVDEIHPTMVAAEAAQTAAEAGQTAAEAAQVAAESADAGVSAMHIVVDTMAADLLTLKKVSIGRWKITEDHELWVYDPDDGVTILYKFALKDIHGLPTLVNIYERLPIPV
jgi:hypothetical protein